MKNLICIILVASFFLYGCKGVSGSNGNAAVDKESSEEESKSRMIMLNPNMAEEAKLQKAVDNGGQTWRLSPIDVAHANLINRGVNARIEDCSLVKADDTHAVVRVLAKDGKDLNVYVARLVRPGGIWTATQIEVNKEGGHDHASGVEYEHDHGQMHHH